MKKIIFAAGGSGGHTYPLLAIAREFVQAGWDTSFISCHGSVDEKILEREKQRFTLIPSAKLNGQSPVKVVWGLVRVAGSLVRSAFLVLREKPDFVFSAGGYAGAPFLMAAALLGIPCGILEQNRVPGMANRWMSRFCRVVFLNFAASAEFFPKKFTVAVGHPCREEIRAARLQGEAAAKQIAAQPFRIFVFGGSQGAVGINRLVTAALPFLKGLSVEILHQTGTNDLEAVRSAYIEQNFTAARIEPYVFDMAAAYRDHHFIICRAGASSLAELAAAGKAALLIPLVSRDRHQEPNAAEMERLGAALCRLQPSLDGQQLAHIIKEHYDDRQRLRALSEAIQKLDHPQAAAAVAQKIKELVHA